MEIASSNTKKNIAINVGSDQKSGGATERPKTPHKG
jgi:hypothetical protein